MPRGTMLSRREFFTNAGTCALFTAFAATGFVSARKRLDESPGNIDVAVIDRARVLHAAEHYLRESPITLTAFPASRSAGGKHDYFSEGDYWSPDPKNPGGPYIRRDGMSNPDNFTAHRHALMRLSVQVPALTAAGQITRDERYASHAAKHLRAWFLDPSTLWRHELPRPR